MSSLTNECCLKFSAIYHGENKLHFNEMVMISALRSTNTLAGFL